MDGWLSAARRGNPQIGIGVSRRKPTGALAKSSAPRGVQITIGPDGEVGFELRMAELRAPTKSFSADGVIVQDRAEVKAIHVFFVAANASMNSSRGAVRVRMPYSWAVRQFVEDEHFAERLRKFVEEEGFGTPWTPTLSQLDSLGPDSIWPIDASFMTMTHHGESAMCDVYAVPPNFLLRARANQPWDVEPLLRVMLPTPILLALVDEVRNILANRPTAEVSR